MLVKLKGQCTQNRKGLLFILHLEVSSRGVSGFTCLGFEISASVEDSGILFVVVTALKTFTKKQNKKQLDNPQTLL